MIVEDPLQFVYWNIRKFLAVVLSIQIAFWCVIALEAFGVTLPLARPILGFLYVLLIPGSMALRLLNLRRLTGIELLTYSIGLSIAIVMLLGLSINSLFVGLHLHDPLTVGPLLFAMGALVSILCVACYVRNDATNIPDLIDGSELLTPSILSLSVLPPLAILGTYLFNHYELSAINMGVIALIAALTIMIGFKKQVPKNLYPFALWTVALALLFRQSLVSNYIWGTDIHFEYYVANLVVTGGFWNVNAPIVGLRVETYNIMLGTVILAPVLSNLMGISLQWIFKVVYPLILSFVPLVLYVVFKKQTSDRIAFCAAALIIASFSFYTDMLALPRQQIAELFIALLFLLIVSRELAPPKKTVLLLTYGSALVISHYSLAYIFIYLLLVGLLLLSLRPSRRYLKIITRGGAARLKINLSQQEKQDPSHILKKDQPAISLAFVVFLMVLAFAWYAFLNSAPFYLLVHTGQQMWSSVFSEFFSPSAIQPLETIAGTQGPMATVTKYLYYVITFFAIFGLVSVLLKRHKRPLQRTYIALSIAAAVLLIGCMTLPNFAATLNTVRFYQLAELLLAPFMVVGMIDLLNILHGALSQGVLPLSENTTLSLVAVFLAVFLLFNSGFVYTLAGETTTSAAVLATNPDLKYPRWTDEEVAGAAWLHEHHGQALIYSHGYYLELIGMTDQPSGRIISYNVTEALNSYIFTGVLPTDKQPPNVNQTTQVITAVKNRNQIFSNGDVRIYY